MSEISGDPFKLTSYRIEWRAHLDTQWLVVANVEGHDEALGKRDAVFDEHGGQVRVVVQHVIDAKGLGHDG
jgi:hypothetical protein